jgi:hypothetical protein
MYRKSRQYARRVLILISSRVTLSYPRGEGKIWKDWKSGMEEVMCFGQLNVSLSPIVHPIFLLGTLRRQAASNYKNGCNAGHAF